MPEHALIVDDSRTACRALASLLEGYQISSDSVHSAEQALEYLRHSKPDVIFLDHSMPGMNGLETIKVIKSNPGTGAIPVMMYTSRAGDVYLGQARALGAVDVIPKSQLSERLDDALAKLRGQAPAAEVYPVTPSESSRHDGGNREEKAGAGVHELVREARADLSRQMYLILTEEQIAQKERLGKLMASVDEALRGRTEELYRRLAADRDLAAGDDVLRQRRRVRGILALVTVLSVVVVAIVSWRIGSVQADLTALNAGLGRVEMRLASVDARMVAADEGITAGAGSGSPHATAAAESGGQASPPDSRHGHRLLGLGGVAEIYQVLSDTGYIYGLDSQARVGFPMPVRYFRLPHCNGDAMAAAPAGVVYRDGTELWYTSRADSAEKLAPASKMRADGSCSPSDNARLSLRTLLPNQPEVTGVGGAEGPVSLTALR